ncbi:hypothetical protein ACWD5R_43260 [Streptomyces sp. NPDC002514]|uniref:hypothetical protein n=1 Tax=Streptomyces sp. NPDC001270 TaxID=3364554 RepID=UPI0036AC7A7D
MLFTFPALGDFAADVAPDLVVEGLVDVVAVDPRDLVELPVAEAGPDLAGVVGVVVDFPLAVLGQGIGAPATARVKNGVVVGAVVDADAAFGDGLPAHREQFQVVGSGQRHGYVPAHGDQRGPHLVRREGRLRQHRVAQSVVGPVLPVHDPLVEEVLQLRDRPARLRLSVLAPQQGVGSGVAGDVLAEQVVDRGEGPFHHALGLWPPWWSGLHAHAEGLARGDEALGDVDLPAVDDDRLRHDHRTGRCALKAFVQGQHPLVGHLGS